MTFLQCVTKPWPPIPSLAILLGFFLVTACTSGDSYRVTRTATQSEIEMAEKILQKKWEPEKIQLFHDHFTVGQAVHIDHSPGVVIDLLYEMTRFDQNVLQQLGLTRFIGVLVGFEDSDTNIILWGDSVPEGVYKFD